MSQCFQMTTEAPQRLEIEDVIIELAHHKGDAPECLRLNISTDSMQAQIQPTKGFSIANVAFHGQKLFWDAPIGLFNPDTLNLWGDHIHINGEPSPGFAFLETFAGGIELYGLRNWGMPVTLSSGERLVLHGETSNIPVGTINGVVKDGTISVTAGFAYRTFDGNANVPWYERGKALFHVTRTVEITPKDSYVCVIDTIKNISNQPLTPDWGYHITMRPEPGSRLIVPGGKKMNRGGDELPDDIQTWHPAEDDKVRTEVGIIYRELETTPSETGERIYSDLLYPDGAHIRIGVPPAPYFQTWFCNGGANSTEFTRADGSPLFSKNWDGQGIEIGASALDHDDNTDSDVPPQQPLPPGESISILLDFQLFNR